MSRLARLGLPLYCGGRRPYVALTFDDGPGVYTRLALHILRQAHRTATFFLVGRNLGRFPGFARQEARFGAVGDHTWTHPYLRTVAPAAVRQELARTQAAVRRAAGVPVQLFRPPYGAHDPVVDETARRLGMLEVLWNVDSADSLGANWSGIARNVDRGLRPGAIVLMHENRGQTIRALKFLILPHLRRMHLHVVTVPQLVALDPPSTEQLRIGARGCGLSGGPTGGG